MYKVYYREIVAYVYSLSNNVQQSEDVVQNVMLSIWNKKEKLKIKTSFRSYLYKACYNEYITLYNSHKRELNYINSIEIERMNFFTSLDVEKLSEQKHLVKLAIEKLPPRCKEVFVLNKYSGFKYAEIAEILNISVKTVEAQISKAILLIKRELKI